VRGILQDVLGDVVSSGRALGVISVADWALRCIPGDSTAMSSLSTLWKRMSYAQKSAEVAHTELEVCRHLPATWIGVSHGHCWDLLAMQHARAEPSLLVRTSLQPPQRVSCDSYGRSVLGVTACHGARSSVS
jgi:hypothetical protein